MPFIDIASHRVEYVRIAAGGERRPSLVFLHEGLGSLAMWRDLPERVASETHCDAIVYSRYGYGNSDPLSEQRPVRYMHDEAQIALPQLLDCLAIDQPILIGHSDGGSIALIYAGSTPARVRGVVTLAAHVLVEDISVASIADAKTAYETTDLRARLARYHADVDSAFRGWNDIWLDPAFRDWNIEGYLSKIRCPVLAIQGVDDEYGTMEQMRRIAAGVRESEILVLDDCRHSPHRDQPETVLSAIASFVRRLT
jgi:pimeloyl-ACP methyl ester carboxylesterase